ncbi:MAG TPA: GAF and ANTAR domain-containing protein [Actinocrinis sp.]|nr:GAF and ANTAR domain-containing protein [Actinocrinis sp.]
MGAHGDLVLRILQAGENESGDRPLAQRLCRAWVEGLGIEAVSISVMTQRSSRQLLCASDATALRLEEIQFTVAQGPCISAAQTGAPVLVRDFARETTPWPGFGSMLREQLPSVRSVYAFPMCIGKTVLGCIDVADTEPAGLDEDVVGQAVAAAGLTATMLLTVPDALLAPAPYLAVSGSGDVSDIHWSATARAVGVLAAREDLSIEDALALMRARAFGGGCTLAEVSADILAEFDAP